MQDYDPLHMQSTNQNGQDPVVSAATSVAQQVTPQSAQESQYPGNPVQPMTAQPILHRGQSPVSPTLPHQMPNIAIPRSFPPQQQKTKPSKQKGCTGGRMALVLVLACLLGVLGGGVGTYLVGRYAHQYFVPQRDENKPQDTVIQSDKTTAQTTDSGSFKVLNVEKIAEKATPSVVAIQTQAVSQDLFGQPQFGEAAGSGVILSKDGYIVTNHHVIQNARDINVTLSTGTQLKADLVGSDPSNDIAVIKVEGENLPAIEVASSSDLKVGSYVVAIGNPLGVLEGSVTTGVISSTNRTIHGRNSDLFNVLQTDAAINQGNSGGALVNESGKLVGINSNKFSGEGIEGIAFAIPTDTVMPLVQQLIKNGKVTSPEIGISAFNITSVMQEKYRVPAGIYVQAVKPESLAEKAGIQVNDIITAVNGEAVTSVQSFTALKNRHQLGDTLKLSIDRRGEKQEISLVLSAD